MIQLLLALLLLTSCKPEDTEKVRENLSTEKSELPYGLERFENDEIICYSYFKDSLQCKWKSEK